MIEIYDSKQAYCRKLGHHLHFKYCRNERDGQPCNKIQDCWFEKFDVATYINDNYHEYESQNLEDIQPNKTVTLLNIVQRVQERRLADLHETSN